MRQFWFPLIIGLMGLVILVSRVHAADCGEEHACKLTGRDGGQYFLSAPDNMKPGAPVFVFFHGHNGSGAGVMRNKGLVRALHKEGYVVVAPDGPLFTFRGRTAKGWAARPEGKNPRGKRDDIKFVERVLEDVAGRLTVDLEKTVVSGFSSGGSMAWYFACYAKSQLAGVIGVAGGLRRPLPERGEKQLDGSIAKSCPAGPRKLIHIHGFSDRQVPLEGRGIRSWHQGDVFEGLAVQRHTNGCRSRPSKMTMNEGFWCRDWTGCQSAQSIRLCLHPGGHGMPKGWLSKGLDWLSAEN